VDQFAQNNAIFQRSKQRIDRSFGHCRGILIDVFYDHLLARHWDTYSPQSLEDFAGRIYDLLAGNSSYLPAGLQRIAPHMIRNNWLVSYRETATVGRVLERLAGRLRRPNPLAAGLPELLENYVELEGDCRDFLSEAAAYVRAMG
jgi:acyl carrier protein phosphodiesterase